MTYRLTLLLLDAMSFAKLALALPPAPLSAMCIESEADTSSDLHTSDTVLNLSKRIVSSLDGIVVCVVVSS